MVSVSEGRVRNNMNEWTEIRRKVLVEGVSKLAIRREYGVGWDTLEKILTHLKRFA